MSERAGRCAFCDAPIFGGEGGYHTEDGREVCPSGASPTTFHEPRAGGSVFDEQRLRQDIATTWGEHGAHIDVFDRMLRLAESCDLATMEENLRLRAGIVAYFAEPDLDTSEAILRAALDA